MNNQTEIKSLVDQAFEEVAKRAVENVIASHIGRGIDSDVKVAIREMAHEIVKTDEIRAIIRERLLYWIAQE